jgi:hypothetical protein
MNNKLARAASHSNILATNVALLCNVDSDTGCDVDNAFPMHVAEVFSSIFGGELKAITPSLPLTNANLKE